MTDRPRRRNPFKVEDYLERIESLGKSTGHLVAIHDTAHARFNQDQVKKILNLFDGEDRAKLQATYDEAYRQGSGFYTRYRDAVRRETGR